MGAGRPKGRSKPALLFVRVEQEIADAVTKQADKRGVSVSDVIRDALLRLVKSTKRRPKKRRS